MNPVSIRVAVLNSLLFVRDRSIEDIPAIDGRGAVWATNACIAVSCLPDCDGETKVTIGTAEDVGLKRTPLFDGYLQTPGRDIVVEDITRHPLLEARVRHARTRMRIWTNGDRATDIVVIGLD
jgi:hypothetical protein